MKEKKYHWYATNLECAAELIYPIYRLRWQVELSFKATKRSFNLADMSSANANIIKNLVLLAIIANLISRPLANEIVDEEKIKSKKRAAMTFQRVAVFALHAMGELRQFLLTRTQKNLDILWKKLRLFRPELFEPNYQRRETSLQRAVRIAKELS